ncbi:uncharacterized protein IAS62_003264 [Cryptococcus decagattii]|uniref:Zn(2)-C6 fungal-type domain-containing protein n=1 Tax=Cryptococcus decagattii TaxID=1859122 RepID=A0ABZ2AVQ7_9TREE
MADFDYGFARLQTSPATAPNDNASQFVSAPDANDEGRLQATSDGNSDAERDNGEKKGGPSADLGVAEGSNSAHGGAQPPADPRFPYANLLASDPIQPSDQFRPDVATGYHPYYLAPDHAASSKPHESSSQPLPSLQNSQTPHRTQISRQQHRLHPYQTSQSNIMNRHTTARAHWDDVSSPDQDVQAQIASANSSAANTPASVLPPPPPPPAGTSEATEGTISKPTGRSGQKRRKKYTRTRTGCLCCRSRRIKCDEARPVCKRCTIAKRECVYPDGAGSSNPASGTDAPGVVNKGIGRSSGEDSESENDRDRKGRPGSPSALRYPPIPNGGLRYGGGSNVYDASALNMAPMPGGLVGNGMGGGMSLMEMGMAQQQQQQQHQQQQLSAQGRGGFGSEAGKQEWGLEQGGAPMLSTPNFLLPWFPTAEERSLILHYCANAASLLMAIPSGLNPMLAINLPLALDSPRGMNPSADALRVALLGIGAIHQAFLLARSGVSNHQTAAMFQYASTLRDTGKEMVRRAAHMGSTGTTDAALGAATALATIDMFFGGSNWQDNFNLAKEMVRARGGPAEMLKASTPKTLTEGVTVSPARLMLEILAIYETFGCLTTGQEPTLISEHGENWWLEASRSTYEEHSVEKQFGMSRVMVLLFVRLTRLINRVAKSNIKITELASSTSSASDPYPQFASLIPTPSSTSGLNGTTSFAEDSLIKEARQLNKDVDIWIESLQISTLEHERVQVGNRAYAYAMKILLLRRVFKYTRDDPRVQSAAQQVLQHCSWSTAALGMSIDLTWPAIIAASCADGSSRQWVMTLLEGFKSQCCFDIDTAARIITEVWRRVDTGEGRADWKEVCDDLGLQVL